MSGLSKTTGAKCAYSRTSLSARPPIEPLANFTSGTGGQTALDAERVPDRLCFEEGRQPVDAGVA
jgi:hypothetical protein